MNENGIQQNTILEELEKLKKEQAEAERIYRGRMQLGGLNHDPASIQQLSQTILERKSRIDDLEAQIAQSKDSSRNQKYEQNFNSTNKRSSENEQHALTAYTGRNLIVGWLQKIINKIEQKIQKLDERSNRNPMDWYKEKFEEEMAYLNDKKYEEYKTMAEMDNSSKEKTTHQIFVDKISGNGAYHTYGPNYKKQESKTMTDPDKNKNIQEQMKQSQMEISER